MEFEDFVKSLKKAGWSATNDAQYTGIRKMWEGMFPVIAKLSAELEYLENKQADYHS